MKAIVITLLLTFFSIVGMDQMVIMEIPNEVWVKIIACSDTATKNALGKCSMQLHRLYSKNNTDIYMHNPLVLNDRVQLEYALSLCSYKNNEAAFENLLRYSTRHPFWPHYYYGILTFQHAIALYKKHHNIVNLGKQYDKTCSSRELAWFKIKTSRYALAAFLGDTGTMRAYVQSKHYSPLFKRYCHLNPDDRYSATLLYAAIARGHHTIVDLLLSHPKTIEYINYGRSNFDRPLDVALGKGDAITMDRILSIPSVHKHDYNFVGYLLHYARHGYTDGVETLLKFCKNIRINQLMRGYFRDVFGETIIDRSPLTTAAYYGHKDVVALLLGCKNITVNIMLYNRWEKYFCNFTPLYAAVLQGHTDVVKLLLAHPDIDPCLYMKKYTPLHIACKKGYIDSVKLLVNRSPQLLYMKTKDTHETPYQIAYHNKHYDVVEFLLQHDQSATLT